MPIVDGKYKNPGWVNNGPPYINASELNDMGNTLENLDNGKDGGSGLSDDAKAALLALLEKVAYVDADGQTYLDALETALYPPANLVSIAALFTQGSAVIYAGDSLDTLRKYLSVTALYDDGTKGVVTAYELSGTLTVGTSTITVSYSGKTTTFNVTVTEYAPPDTSPVIELENKTYTSAGATKALSGSCITKTYWFEPDLDGVRETIFWDAENEYTNTAGALFFAKYLAPSFEVSYGANGKSLLVNQSEEMIDYVSTGRNTTESNWYSNRGTKSNLIRPLGLRFNLSMSGAEYSYAYWSRIHQGSNYGVLPVGVTEGDIIFAGENTPYYGLSNIAEAPELVSITAVYTQGETVVTTGTSLNSLKENLVVTATYDNGRELPVFKALYTLTGTLEEGTSTITVTYNAMTTNFEVVVSAS